MTTDWGVDLRHPDADALAAFAASESGAGFVRGWSGLVVAAATQAQAEYAAQRAMNWFILHHHSPPHVTVQRTMGHVAGTPDGRFRVWTFGGPDSVFDAEDEAIAAGVAAGLPVAVYSGGALVRFVGLDVDPD